MKTNMTLQDWRDAHPDAEVMPPSTGSVCTVIWSDDPALWRLKDFSVSSRIGKMIRLHPDSDE